MNPVDSHFRGKDKIVIPLKKGIHFGNSIDRDIMNSVDSHFRGNDIQNSMNEIKYLANDKQELYKEQTVSLKFNH